MAAMRIWITGASSGIGRETALLLAAQGCSLVLSARRETAVSDLAEECRQAGSPRALAAPGDLTEPGVAADAAEMLRDLPGGEGGVVVCAGMARFGPVAESSASDLAEQVALNLLAAMETCRVAVPILLEEGGGAIVTVASVAAVRVFGGAAAYSASKAGLLAFTRSLAEEVRHDGVRVTALVPGSVDTPLWDGKGWSPRREDMLTSRSVAETIAWVLDLPADRVVDELRLMPPKGVL